MSHDCVRQLNDMLDYSDNLPKQMPKQVKYHLKQALLLLVTDMANEPDPDELTESEIRMVDDGKKIDAIKSVRARTGRGLAESKDFVEKYMAENQDNF
jgi:ribosomal protein L7/L12